MTFLDIGSTTINLAHVVTIHRMSLNRVAIEFDVLDGDGPAQITLYGEEAEMFKDWWEDANTPGLAIFRII